MRVSFVRCGGGDTRTCRARVYSTALRANLPVTRTPTPHGASGDLQGGLGRPPVMAVVLRLCGYSSSPARHRLQVPTVQNIRLAKLRVVNQRYIVCALCVLSGGD